MKGAINCAQARLLFYVCSDSVVAGRGVIVCGDGIKAGRTGILYRETVCNCVKQLVIVLVPCGALFPLIYL